MTSLYLATLLTLLKTIYTFGFCNSHFFDIASIYIYMPFSFYLPWWLFSCSSFKYWYSRESWLISSFSLSPTSQDDSIYTCSFDYLPYLQDSQICIPNFLFSSKLQDNVLTGILGISGAWNSTWPKLISFFSQARQT